MNKGVFEELLRNKKLFDADDQVLRVHKHISQSVNTNDTYFRCVSTGIMGTDRFHIQIRAACILRFIRLMFYVPVECTTVAIFLKEYAHSAKVRGLAYQDEAVQLWVITHTPWSNTNSKHVFQRHKDELKRYALEFVSQNNQVGHLSCRFTFGYLLSGLYNIVVHMYDYVRKQMHIQPPIRRTAHRKGESPSTDEIEQKQMHIYIWSFNNIYQLLVPIVERPTTRGQHWLHKQMAEQTYVYQLRVSSNNSEQNTHVCNFEPLHPDSEIHVCDIVPGDLDTSGIYQVYPAGGSFQLHIEPQQHLFVFSVCESESDVRPHLECLAELEHNITYPYFMLRQDTKRVAVLVSSRYREEVIEQAKKQLNAD